MKKQCRKCQSIHGNHCTTYTHIAWLEDTMAENCDKFKSVVEPIDLEWVDDRYAKTLYCGYQIDQFDGDYILVLSLPGKVIDFNHYITLEEAKQAAQAHFNELVFGLLK